MKLPRFWTMSKQVHREKSPHCNQQPRMFSDDFYCSGVTQRRCMICCIISGWIVPGKCGGERGDTVSLLI